MLKRTASQFSTFMNLLIQIDVWLIGLSAGAMVAILSWMIDSILAMAPAPILAQQRNNLFDQNGKRK
jgi:hypothetical protein